VRKESHIFSACASKVVQQERAELRCRQCQHNERRGKDKRKAANGCASARHLAPLQGLTRFLGQPPDRAVNICAPGWKAYQSRSGRATHVPG